MSANNTSGTILIKQGTPLPARQTIETELFLLGWNLVKNLDRHGLARKIKDAHWNFFYLAGAIKAPAIGRDLPRTLRRAAQRAPAAHEWQSFNSFEVAKAVSKRFLGIPFLRITANSRHIQAGMSLVPAKDFVLRAPAATLVEQLARKHYAEVSSGSLANCRRCENE